MATRQAVLAIAVVGGAGGNGISTQIDNEAVGALNQSGNGNGGDSGDVSGGPALAAVTGLAGGNGSNTQIDNYAFGLANQSGNGNGGSGDNEGQGGAGGAGGAR